ncbi:MAG: ribosome-associated translation inhibitor RaiA [Rickettsiales bacterium]|nr:ribosome-associated translation inhibitor RaiA [Pseudomonadota bacterium]MDA0967300.1 ribosome-associated translation inhibitor RaiA [Pseudomonadota bacterium]MDG4544039.1 ribosome-associated translation inhibitor RaiA [Rickettsiales bacterium]MDG4546267.1 ribosome-associated translation inhibitor RaiA [Rickettsiales bacterium]MDG4548363.1 ribosome-associated translation inhibitor RaiA [Rickettsiales bacterium]
MQITVSGKHLEIGTALQEYVIAELEAVVTKYFEHAISADVVFTKERHLFKADILVNEGTGNSTLMKGSAEDDEVYTAFDLCSAKVEKQLRRYKGRIKNHHKTRIDKDNVEFITGTKYILSSEVDAKDSELEDYNDAPLIIAEKPTEIETLTVSDAVMRMDLGQLPALMFINKKTGSVNVVYRREDGNISWIDSARVAKEAAA